MLQFLILCAGLLLTIAAAALMWWPRLRLPSLAFALFAIPGNVDNLWPQMALDPHAIAHNTAPIVSVIDVLIAWAVVLTWNEGRRVRMRSGAGWLLAIALGLAVVALISASVAVVGGVSLGAGVHGVLVFVRLAALLYLGVALRDVTGTGRWLAGALALSVIPLVANGIYTSAVTGAERFTASTIGRNGFAVALSLAAVAAGGLALGLRWRDRRTRAIGGAAAVLAFLGLAAAVGTGTRIFLVALAAGIVVALIANRTWLRRPEMLRVASAGGLLVLALVSGALLSRDGMRALSVITNPGETISIVTNPGGQPSYSPVTSRTQFWKLAVTMAEAHPLVGVGPYQWNFVRYQLNPRAAPLVADPHNVLLQIAAEFGLPAAILYLLLLLSGAWLLLTAIWRQRTVIAHDWVATGLLVAAVMYPITELTNSNLFNIRTGPAGWLLLAVALGLVYLREEGAPDVTPNAVASTLR